MGILDDKSVKEGISVFSEVTGLIAFPVVGGALLGQWLDLKYSTDPWLIIISTAVGILIASISIANIIKKYTKK